MLDLVDDPVGMGLGVSIRGSRKAAATGGLLLQESSDLFTTEGGEGILTESASTAAVQQENGDMLLRESGDILLLE